MSKDLQQLYSGDDPTIAMSSRHDDYTLWLKKSESAKVGAKKHLYYVVATGWRTRFKRTVVCADINTSKLSAELMFYKAIDDPRFDAFIRKFVMGGDGDADEHAAYAV